MDSLTRLGRAFNTAPNMANTGRTLSGGLDAGALAVPKQLFGAARRFEEGLRVYSFGDLGGNTKMEWLEGSGSNGKEWNGIYPNTFDYFNLTARAL